MNKILVLWATPRSTSTAFEWMMRVRGDMACFHEPFGEWWHQGEDAPWPRIQENSPRTPGLTYEKVWQTMDEAAKEKPVFSKDFPHYTKHAWSNEFLGRFNHSFLIRDPAKVLMSMAKLWPDFLLEETSVIEQRQLFDRLKEESGTPPPLIDSDDLMEDPQRIVRLWCEAVNISFIPEALSWEPGDRSELYWYDDGSWHAGLRESDGLKPRPRKDVDILKAPERIQELYEIVLPHYQYMYEHRIR